MSEARTGMTATHDAPDLASGFTLALGGGGARGWAHVGVATVLEERGLRPTRIVGTSMGAIVGAGLAAGRTPEEIRAAGLRTQVYRHIRRGRLALFDSRPLIELITADLGDPRIEELPTPLGITAFDLVTGHPRLITEGRLGDALEKSIAAPLFFSPCPDEEGVWCDAGPWEGVPVTLAREWAPELPVIGVLADIPKLGVFAGRFSAALLRAASATLGIGSAGDRLTARRYLALLAARWADPVVEEPADLLIAPRLGWLSALQYGRVNQAAAIGARDARLVLDELAADAA
ncbi:MAG TPA: patatin-like phospholipase family protein [Candidatus Limnocylindria bacterium]|nr:patatin-like phospholipase family protein [Candidatus Limnocylindria bacterium]